MSLQDLKAEHELRQLDGQGVFTDSPAPCRITPQPEDDALPSSSYGDPVCRKTFTDSTSSCNCVKTTGHDRTRSQARAMLGWSAPVSTQSGARLGRSFRMAIFPSKKVG